MSTEPSKVSRGSVADLDEILGYRFQVLDDGFYRVIDYMGSDSAIVQAARVSYGRGTKRVQQDHNLIRYLLRHGHTTPFEMCEIKLHVRVPMDCWRQWIRHRTASVNEYSTRYSVAIDAAQTTAADGWRIQGSTNRQGSDGFLSPEIGSQLSHQERDFQKTARGVYDERLAVNVAREQARKDLPLSTYTEAYWKVDLHNLLHFLALRMNERAQFEIRQFAVGIGHEVVRRWCPIAWQAFLDYRLNGITLSSREIAIARAVNLGEMESARALAGEFGWVGETAPAAANRERDDAQRKLDLLGIDVPWI